MDSAPPLFKRKKTRPSRQREVDDEDLDNNPEQSVKEDSPMTLAAKLKNKQKARAKPQSRLSFEADQEEGETFQVKKSQLSRKIKLGGPSSSASPSIVAESTQESGTPLYTSAYLSQLKASTALPPTPVAPGNAEDILDFESTVAYTVEDLEAMGVADNGFEDTIAPSTASVVEAKKNRERMRITGKSGLVQQNEEEFVSLTVAKRSENTDLGPHPESRLMREEDDLGEGDDDLAEFTGAKERIALGKKARKEEAKQKRLDMMELIENADDDDEETREWQSAQTRRNAGESLETVTPVTYKPAPIPTASSVPNLTSSIANLTASLTALTTSHAGNTTALSSLADERLLLQSKEANLRKMVEEAETKRSWFSNFKQWMDSLADLLDDKFPALEKLEEEHVSLLHERAEMINKRRKQDDEDDLSLFLSTPLPQGMEEETDDLGRSISGRTGPRSVARRARRDARAHRRSSRSPMSTSEDFGYSTDSSLQSSDASDFEIAIESLKTRIRSLLSDVKAKEFKDPNLGVAKKFAEWRGKYPDVYNNAWGGLGVVGAWEFWARLEMVGWDPLQETRALDSFPWYSNLYDYSRPRLTQSDGMDLDDADEDEPELGPDGDLVVSMVSTALIPRLTKLVGEGALDPYSAKHIRRLVDLAEQVEMCVKRDDPKFQALIREVIQVFSTAIRSTRELVSPCFGPDVAPPPFEPEAPAARKQFLTRQLKLLSCLLQWRKYAGERFGIGEMTRDFLRDVILPISESGWDVGGSAIVKRVNKILPPDLILDGIRDRLLRP